MDGRVVSLRALAFSDGAKAQRIHHCQRTRAHGENVAQYPAHAGGGALKRLDVRRMVVRFDLEGADPAVANVDDAGVLARPLDHQLGTGWQPLQVYPGGLVGTML